MRTHSIQDGAKSHPPLMQPQAPSSLKAPDAGPHVLLLLFWRAELIQLAAASQRDPDIGIAATGQTLAETCSAPPSIFPSHDTGASQVMSLLCLCVFSNCSP